MVILELDIVPVKWQCFLPLPAHCLLLSPFAVNICSICFNLDAEAGTPVGKKLLRS